MLFGAVFEWGVGRLADAGLASIAETLRAELVAEGEAWAKALPPEQALSDAHPLMSMEGLSLERGLVPAESEWLAALQHRYRLARRKLAEGDRSPFLAAGEHAVAGALADLARRLWLVCARHSELLGPTLLTELKELREALREAREPGRPGVRRQEVGVRAGARDLHLGNLLLRMFDDAGLERFVLSLPSGQRMWHEIPTDGSRMDRSFRTAQRLGYEGLTTSVFDRLVELRPQRVDEIAEVARMSEVSWTPPVVEVAALPDDDVDDEEDEDTAEGPCGDRRVREFYDWLRDQLEPYPVVVAWLCDTVNIETVDAEALVAELEGQPSPIVFAAFCKLDHALEDGELPDEVPVDLAKPVLGKVLACTREFREYLAHTAESMFELPFRHPSLVEPLMATHDGRSSGYEMRGRDLMGVTGILWRPLRAHIATTDSILDQLLAYFGHTSHLKTEERPPVPSTIQPPPFEGDSLKDRIDMLDAWLETEAMGVGGPTRTWYVLVYENHPSDAWVRIAEVCRQRLPRLRIIRLTGGSDRTRNTVYHLLRKYFSRMSS